MILLLDLWILLNNPLIFQIILLYYIIFIFYSNTMAEKKETQEIKTLFQKLLQLQSKNIAVEKNGKNSFFKDWKWQPSSYVVLDDIMNAYKVPLSECWLFVYNFIRTDDETNYVVTRIVDSDNEDKFIENIFPIAKLWTPQAMGSAVSYGKRYNIWALLCIATEVDADGNNAPEIKKVELKEWEVFQKIIIAIKEWKWTIEQVKSKYIISEEIENKILELTSNKW